MKSGIYQIRNTKDNKIYIGSAVNLTKRKNNHFSHLRRNLHSNKHLQNAFNKHGRNNFIFEVLITCHKSMLIWYEQQFLDQWKPEYNKRKKAENNLGISKKPCSEETKEKIRQAQIGKPRRPMSNETKLKISLANKGKIKSKAWRDNLAKAQIGKTHSAKSNAKNRKAHLGKKHSEKSKLKISKSMKLYRENLSA